MAKRKIKATKNKKTDIRINEAILAKLKEIGRTPQKIIDEEIERLFDVNATVEVTVTEKD